MWPPVEAGSPKRIWGLPVNILCILISFLVILIFILAALFVCCWLLPRRRKILSPLRHASTTSTVSGDGLIMAHQSLVVAKSLTDCNSMMSPTIGLVVSPRYNVVQPPPLSSSSLIYQQHNQCSVTLVHQPPDSNRNSMQNIQETHKSMWAINPSYISSNVSNESDSAYRTRSLPVWGRSKPRPVSTTDCLEELYAKVNFSKKRKNRMRNDEAAIIALSRSRSQNLQGIPFEREGVVVYDERTAL